MQIGRFTFEWHSVGWISKFNWARDNYKGHPHRIDYYITWFNWLPKEARFWGLEQDWYDGPHKCFGFWFFNWAWSTPWTNYKEKEL